MTPNRGNITAIGGILLLLSFSSHAVNGDREIGKMVNGHFLTISTCDHDAGAICSVTWKGKEFIDDHDKGRQLQSAATFDHMEELWNPTEAGASQLTDGFNPSPSSSYLLGLNQLDTAIVTYTQMAFWNPVSGKVRSDHILRKAVSIGYMTIPNVIPYNVRYTIPEGESHFFGKFEHLTGYMPAEFSKFYTYEPKSRVLGVLSDGPGEQPLPIIFSTPDGAYAMGIYTVAGQCVPSYGRWRHTRDRVVKWNTVCRVDYPSGEIEFQDFVLIGTLEQVKRGMSVVDGL